MIKYLHENSHLKLIFKSFKYTKPLLEMKYSFQFLRKNDSSFRNYNKCINNILINKVNYWNKTYWQFRKMQTEINYNIDNNELKNNILDEKHRKRIQQIVHTYYESMENDLKSFILKKVELLKSSRINSKKINENLSTNSQNNFSDENLNPWISIISPNQLNNLCYQIEREIQINRIELIKNVNFELNRLGKKLVKEQLKDSLFDLTNIPLDGSVSIYSNLLSKQLQIPKRFLYEYIRSETSKKRRKLITHNKRREILKIISNYEINNIPSLVQIASQTIDLPDSILRELIVNEIRKKKIKNIDLKKREEIYKLLDSKSYSGSVSELTNQIKNIVSAPREFIYDTIRNWKRKERPAISQSEMGIILNSLKKINDISQLNKVYKEIENQLDFEKHVLYYIINKEFRKLNKYKLSQSDKEIIHSAINEGNDMKQTINTLCTKLEHLHRWQIAEFVNQEARKIPISNDNLNSIREIVQNHISNLLSTNFDTINISENNQNINDILTSIRIKELVDQISNIVNIPRRQLYYHTDRIVKQEIKKLKNHKNKLYM